MTRKRKRLIIVLAILVVGVTVAWAMMSHGQDRSVVQTGKVERVGKLDSVVSASGEIRAKDFVDLQTEIPGVIIDLPVKEGDTVTQGQVLLRIDPFQAKQDVASAQATYDAATADESSAQVQISIGEATAARDEYSVTAAISDLTQAESNRDYLKAQFERKRKLRDEELISTDDFDLTNSTMLMAEGKVLSAKAHVDQAKADRDLARVTIDQWRKQHEAAARRSAVARANLERMQDLLAKTTITSPLGGVITKLNVSKGERAVPGIQSNPEATLMTIADLSTIDAEMKVDETDIINVALDDRCEVTVDALPDVKLKGFVTEIGNSPIGDVGQLLGNNQSQDQSKDFKVVVRIEDPPPSLRPGLSASAEIYVDHRDDALVIPLQAVTIREVEVDADGKYVVPDLAAMDLAKQAGAGAGAEAAAADASAAPKDEKKEVPKKELEGIFFREGERVRFRPVKLGIKGESDVEVLEGITEGDEIVTGSYRVLRVLADGDFVDVQNGEGLGLRMGGPGKGSGTP